MCVCSCVQLYTYSTYTLYVTFVLSYFKVLSKVLSKYESTKVRKYFRMYEGSLEVYTLHTVSISGSTKLRTVGTVRVLYLRGKLQISTFLSRTY